MFQWFVTMTSKDEKSICIPLGNQGQNWKTEERNGDRYRENEHQYINMEAGFFSTSKAWKQVIVGEEESGSS